MATGNSDTEIHDHADGGHGHSLHIKDKPCKLSLPRWAIYLSRFLACVAAIATGVITGVAVLLTLPSWGLAMAIIIGVGGALTEGAVFLAGTEKVFELIHHALHDHQSNQSRWGILSSIFVVLLAIGNGIGFGAITYTHTLMALTAIPFIPVPILIPLAIIFAICAAAAWGMVMYQVLNNCLGSFRSFFKSLSLARKQNMSTRDKWVYALKCFTIVLIPLVLIGSLLATLGTAGAWLEAMRLCFQQLFMLSAWANTISQFFTFVFVIPVSLIFFVMNLFALLKFAIDIAESGWSENTEKPTCSVWWWRIGVVLALVLFVLHAIGAGALAGEGVNDPQDLFGGIFAMVTRGLHWMFGVTISPVIIAVSSAALVEGADIPSATGIEANEAEKHDHDHTLVPRLFKWVGEGVERGYESAKRGFARLSHSHEGISTESQRGSEVSSDGLQSGGSPEVIPGDTRQSLSGISQTSPNTPRLSTLIDL